MHPIRGLLVLGFPGVLIRPLIRWISTLYARVIPSGTSFSRKVFVDSAMGNHHQCPGRITGVEGSSG
jgi:hypothetical protein